MGEVVGAGIGPGVGVTGIGVGAGTGVEGVAVKKKVSVEPKFPSDSKIFLPSSSR